MPLKTSLILAFVPPPPQVIIHMYILLDVFRFENYGFQLSCFMQTASPPFARHSTASEVVPR